MQEGTYQPGLDRYALQDLSFRNCYAEGPAHQDKVLLRFAQVQPIVKVPRTVHAEFHDLPPYFIAGLTK